MSKYYLHKIELGTGRSAIVIDNSKKPATTYAYLNSEPIVYSNSERVPNKIYWTLGEVKTENEANQLVFVLAEHYGCDVMANGKLLGLPYMGKSGEWVSRSDAAAALGKIKSEKKTLANRAKANLPPKEGKRQRGRPSKTQPTLRAPVHAEQKCPSCEGTGFVTHKDKSIGKCYPCNGTGISTRSAGG